MKKWWCIGYSCWIQWFTTSNNIRLLTRKQNLALSIRPLGVCQRRFLKPVFPCFSSAAKSNESESSSFFPRWSSYTRFDKSDDEQLLKLRDDEHKTWLDISIQLGRSISSCLSRYQLLKSEEPINLHFTMEEDLKLKQLVEEGKSWVEIAKQLNKPYPHVCKRRYEDTLKNENRRGEFTTEEDNKIIELIQKYGGGKWSLIAQELGTRTAHQCLLRYERVLRPYLKRGAFREEEDILLMKLYEKYGPRWSKMEKEMPWRSSVQIRKRYYTLEEQAKRNKNPWTREEEDKLLALFEKYGRKWTKIAKELKTRSASQCMYQISECAERGELEKILTWTEERDQELRELVDLYGEHWVYISRRMKYFSPRECQERFVDRKDSWNV